ncbi:hypothetical protein Tco_0550804 [Tanacetum coccineum]
MAKKIDTGLDVEEEINTGREEINTGIEEVSTGSTKVDSGTASKRGQREGKAPMVEEDIQATHKTKEQMRQEEAGLEEAIKLQAQLDEEVAKQIHLDKMVAKRMAEEEALSEQQKKRKAQVQFEAQFYTEEDWDVIRAKLEANAELSKDVLGNVLGMDLLEQFCKKNEFKDTWKALSVNEKKLLRSKEEEHSKKNRIKKRSKRLERDKGTEDAYDRVLWSDLRTMFDHLQLKMTILELTTFQQTGWFSWSTKALATPEQTATGKENSNPLIADSLLKTIRISMDWRMDRSCAANSTHIWSYSDKHNMVAFLKKPNESVGFTEVVDFLKGTSLRYALTHNPTIYDSLVKQFWQTVTVRTLANGTQQLVASIDSKEYTITEAFVRSKLQLADATGIHNLSDAETMMD